MKRRRIDVLIDPAFVDGLDGRSLDELGAMRDEVDHFENELSFYRRVLHGRLDVLRFEVGRRRGDDSRSIIEALPELLAAGATGPVSGDGNALDRLHADFAPELPEVERRFARVMDDDILTRLPDLGDDELALSIEELTALEEQISGQRAALHGVHDAIVREIAERHVATDPA